MPAPSPHWKEITPSEFPWEREALDFIKERFPRTSAHRAWSNFEFIASDGSINEVDLLAVTPRGVFLVEIKSWPERIEGDQGTWYRIVDERRERAEDNPLLLNNRKAKRLKSLLEATRVPGRKSPLPFFKALVFLSHVDVQPRLERAARLGVTVRDAGDEGSTAGGLDGIVDTLTRVTAEDRQRRSFRPLSAKDVELIARSLETAGIRESRRHRRVGDYDLGELIDEGPGYQEYAARHASIAETERRVRIFTSSSGLDREIVVEAARREFRALDPLQHPGILSPRDYVDHELGPALLYDREPKAVSLDHYLALRGSRLDIEQRLGLVRRLAEALLYAHARGLVHRALAPRSILVCDPEATHPRLRIRDWHTSQREAVTSSHSSGQPTGHLEQLVDSAAEVYLAPEARRSRAGEHLDVFGLGAIAFEVFTGRPPAGSPVERQAHLEEHGGLDIGAVIDGAAEGQRLCVLIATSPDVSQRTESVKSFLGDLDDVEEELTEPATDEQTDPTTAGKGDLLLDLRVERRLGSGATAVAYLVADADEQRVLKVALTPSSNERLRAEAEILGQVHAPGIVTLHRGDLTVAGHAAIVIEFAGEETLGERIKREGPLGLELLERLGEDLLRALSALEEQGVSHRDIKPANIGVGRRGRTSQLRLVLFDFSLSGAPLEATGAGTPPYLDPFMAAPPRGRFDLHAERFAAAMTLHEMAGGQLPRWGDGLSDPASIEAEVTVEPELFAPAVAKRLAEFFRRALARSASERFDTAEEMLRAWRECFTGTAVPVTTDHGEEIDPEEALRRATLTTPVAELGLSARGNSALERAGISTVAGVLGTSQFELRSLPGVGAGTRGELVGVLEALRERLGDEEAPDVQGLDLLARQLVPRRGWEEEDLVVVRAYLGLSGRQWQSTAEVAEALGGERSAVEAVLDRARERWGKSLRSVTRLRDEIAELLEREGGVLPASMLEEGILARRGAVAEGEERSQLAAAAARAALDAEPRREVARFVAVRLGGGVVIVAPALAEPDAALSYLGRLCERASALAREEPVDAARAASELEAVEVPAGMPAPARGRLVRLAAAVAGGVAANDRGELYPVGMSGEIAVSRAAGALAVGSTGLSLDEVRKRVLARYPEAEPPPGRPTLDELLEGFGLRWKAERARYEPALTVPSSSQLTSSGSASADADEPGAHFAERLDRSRDRFLALTVRGRRAAHAERALAGVGGISHVALDTALIEHMRTIAAAKRADWAAVLELDSTPRDSRNWRILEGLARDAAAALRERLLATEGTVLASRPGLLARYGQLGMLDEVRRQIDVAGHGYPLQGLWLLVPSGGGPPAVEGTPVPVIDENEWARIPLEWVESHA
ncbi:MAG: BREX system serine/threonine kinase PglW [Actinomycetota bacterium]|nr:BREX system serine/threonine kinase PglW [Actinomycetota bacterium]